MVVGYTRPAWEDEVGDNEDISPKQGQPNEFNTNSSVLLDFHFRPSILINSHKKLLNQNLFRFILKKFSSEGLLGYNHYCVCVCVYVNVSRRFDLPSRVWNMNLASLNYFIQKIHQRIVLHIFSGPPSSQNSGNV
jgi:hypothetical protein